MLGHHKVAVLVQEILGVVGHRPRVVLDGEAVRHPLGHAEAGVGLDLRGLVQLVGQVVVGGLRVQCCNCCRSLADVQVRSGDLQLFHGDRYSLSARSWWAACTHTAQNAARALPVLM